MARTVQNGTYLMVTGLRHSKTYLTHIYVAENKFLSGLTTEQNLKLLRTYLEKGPDAFMAELTFLKKLKLLGCLSPERFSILSPIRHLLIKD